MLIANKELLDVFVQTHASAVKPLNTWVERVKEAQWKCHSDLKLMFPSADYVKNGRYVFNIAGNNFRIVASHLCRRSNEHTLCRNACRI